MIVSSIGCWAAARLEHNKYFDRVVNRRRKRYAKNLPKAVVNFVEVNHSRIRDGDEAEFRKLFQEFDHLTSNYALRTVERIRTQLRKIYNYDAFSIKSTSGAWCAYRLCEKLSISTCPYCNLAYGHTLFVSSDGKIRPELDHFFDKATFPLFAISLGNLIPSCHLCNSSLKGCANFYAYPHLNPLEDNEVIKISLDVDPLLARNDVRLISNANIKFEFDGSNSKARNSVKTFLLKDRYQLLVEEARATATYLINYRTNVGTIAGSLEWAMRGVDQVNYKNRILGKMIIDLQNSYL